MTPYETLGVGKDASAEDVKRAYRRRAAKAHPDKGGSNEEMAKLNRAYATLSDATRRAEYDRTGNDSAGPSTEELVGMALAEGFSTALNSFLPRGVPVVDVVRKWLKTKRKDIASQQSKHQQEIKRLKDSRGRVRSSSERNIWTGIIDQQVERLSRNLETIRRDLAVCDAALEALNGYESVEDIGIGIDVPTTATFTFDLYK